MKIRENLHSWNLDTGGAAEVQAALAGRVVEQPLLEETRIVAGIDAAFTRDKTRCLACIVNIELRTMRTIEVRYADATLTFPYIPGFLSFREAPAIVEALKKLETIPDVILCDGHGRAHPRSFGLACHIGLIADVPTVGCAKSRLIGTFSNPAELRGSSEILYSSSGKQIGIVLRTRTSVKPIFVSVGHKIDSQSAVNTVLACGGGYRLPEPTRRADLLVAEYKKRNAAE